MSMLAKDLIDTVCGIYVINKNSEYCVGTGFIVNFLNEVGDYVSFLVTNNHVIEDHFTYYVKFNHEVEGTNSFILNSTQISNKNLFARHDNPSIDICAIRLNTNIILETKSQVKAIHLDSGALRISEMESNKVYEGSIVYSIGFPMNLVDIHQVWPIVRMGNISRIRDVYRKYKSEKAFLVDTFAFPGNSGGPVFLRAEVGNMVSTSKIDHNFLIGILNSYIPYEDRLYSAQTNKTMMIQTQNSGLTKVFSVDYIYEVCEKILDPAR